MEVLTEEFRRCVTLQRCIQELATEVFSIQSVIEICGMWIVDAAFLHFPHYKPTLFNREFNLYI